MGNDDEKEISISDGGRGNVVGSKIPRKRCKQNEETKKIYKIEVEHEI